MGLLVQTWYMTSSAMPGKILLLPLSNITSQVSSPPLLPMSTQHSPILTVGIYIATLSFVTPISFPQCPSLHCTVETQKTYGIGWTAYAMRELNHSLFPIIRTVPVDRCSSLWIGQATHWMMPIPRSAFVMNRSWKSLKLKVLRKRTPCYRTMMNGLDLK